MALVGWQIQAIANAEVKASQRIGELQSGTASEQGHPFVFLLVIPKAWRAAGLTGVNQFQAPVATLLENAYLLLSSRGQRSPQ